MNDFAIKAAKMTTKFCVDRTVSEGIYNVTANYSDSNFKKAVKFIGREAIGLCVSCAMGKFIDDTIDKAAEEIADAIIYVKEAVNKNK